MDNPLPSVAQEVRLSRSSLGPGDSVRIVSVVRNVSATTVDLVSGHCNEIPRIDGVLEQVFTRQGCLGGPARRIALAPGAEHEEDGLALVRRVAPGDYVVRVWHAFDPGSRDLDELAMVGNDVTIIVTPASE